MASMLETFERQKIEAAEKYEREKLKIGIRNACDAIKRAAAKEPGQALDVALAMVEDLAKLRDTENERLQREFMKAGGLAVVPPAESAPADAKSGASRSAR